MFSAPFLVTLLDRVKAVVRRVVRPAVERSVRLTASSPATQPVSAALRDMARGWMSAKLNALWGLMRRIDTGQTIEPSASPSRRAHVNRISAQGLRETASQEERLPRGFGWMCAFEANARLDGQAFAEWLNEPATQAMVMCAPGRMARLMGPLLNATGQRRPEWFSAVPKREQNSARTGAPGHGALSGPSLDATVPSRPLDDTCAVASDRRVKPGDESSLIETNLSRAVTLPRGGWSAWTGYGTSAFEVVPPATPFLCAEGSQSKMRLRHRQETCAHFVTLSKRNHHPGRRQPAGACAPGAARPSATASRRKGCRYGFAATTSPLVIGSRPSGSVA